MTDLQNKYDILLEDIKLLLQYDDKYMKIDKTKLVKPNILLNELKKKISDIKQKKSGIALQIKNNNDKKELLINDISSITTQNTNIEKEISELNNNTKIIQEEQQLKLDLINSKCKELEEFSDTIQNQLQKDIFNHNKVLNNVLFELYLSKDTFNKKCSENNNKRIEEINKSNNQFMININKRKEELIKHNEQMRIAQRRNDFNTQRRGMTYNTDSYNIEIENDYTIINYRKIIESQNTFMVNLKNQNSLYDNKNNIIDKIKKTINNINIISKIQILDNLIDKLLFTNYILLTLKLYKIENYYIGFSNYEEIIHLQKKINDYNIKLSLINNTDIDVNYIKELKKQNIELENDDIYYSNLIITYEIKINKLKKTILELEEMELEISNQIKQNNTKEKNIDTIEQHMRLTKLQKNLKKEIKDNKAKKNKLEINAKEEEDIENFDYKNEYIKKITESQSCYLIQLTNLINKTLNKNIEQLIIENLNIYDIELQQSKEKLEHIKLLYKTINDITIDVNTYNSSNIKIIETSIQKAFELNTNSSKNIDIIKEKNDEIQKLLSLNTNLNLEIDNYNIEISKLEVEFTIIEKVYNLRQLYSS